MAKQDMKMAKSKSADEIAQMLVNNFFLEDLAYMIAYHMDEATLKGILEDEGLDTSFFASTKKSKMEKTPVKKSHDGMSMGRDSLTLFKELIQSIKSEMGIDVGDDDGFDTLYQFYVNSVHYYNEMVGGEGERFYASTKKSKMKKSNALTFGYHKGFYDENTEELKATCIQRCTYEIRDDEGYVLLSGIKANDFEDAIDTFATEKDVGILWIGGESFDTYGASTKKSKMEKSLGFGGYVDDLIDLDWVYMEGHPDGGEPGEYYDAIAEVDVLLQYDNDEEALQKLKMLRDNCTNEKMLPIIDEFIIKLSHLINSSKSTKKSKQPSIDISFEASVNSLRKTNYAKCGNINTIVKERK